MNGGSADNYRPDVDGLRAVAVLGVIVYHMNPEWLPGGFVGVDIFFVISGFVVTMSLVSRENKEEGFMIINQAEADSLVEQGEQGKEGTQADVALQQATEGSTSFGIQTVDFYARRAKRLLPVLVLVCFATSSIFHYAIPSSEYESLKDFYSIGMAGLFGNANNWLVFGLHLPYWDPTGKALADYNPFLHLWSLGVEEQFYIFMPFILRVSSVSNICFRVLLFLSTVISLSISCYWSVTDDPIAQMYAFYLLPARFWELAFGVIVACLQKQVSECLQKKTVVVYLLDWLALVTLVASLLYTRIDQGFPCPWGLLPTLSACLCIIAGMARETSLLGKLLGVPPLNYIGTLSYSMYLWHVPVLTCMAWVDGPLRRTAKGCFLCGSIILVLSQFSFYLVEDPIRRKTRSGSMKVLFFSLLAVGGCAAWLQVFRSAPSSTTGFETQPSAHRSQCRCKMTGHSEPRPVVASDEKGLPPCFEEHANSDLGYQFPEWMVAYGGTCYTQYVELFNNSAIRNCLPRLEVPTVYLLGDSHSVPTRFALRKALPSGYQLRFHSLPSSMLRHHPEFYNNITARVKRILKPSDLVIVHERLDICDHWCTSADNFKRRMKMLIEACEGSGTKMLMFADNPLLPEAPAKCMLPGNSGLCRTTLESQYELQAEKREVIAALRASHKETVYFFDQLPLFCSNAHMDEKDGGGGGDEEENSDEEERQGEGHEAREKKVAHEGEQKREEHKKVADEGEGGREEHKKVTIEGGREEHEKVAAEGERIREEHKKVADKGEGGREEHKKVTIEEGGREEHEKVAAEGERTREEHKKVAAEEDGGREENEKVAAEGEREREERKKVTLETSSKGSKPKESLKLGGYTEGNIPAPQARDRRLSAIAEPSTHNTNQPQCLATVPGTKTRGFFDITHPSQWGAEHLWPFLCHYMDSHSLLNTNIQEHEYRGGKSKGN